MSALAGEWRAMDPDPFTSPDFLLPWWKAFGEGELVALTARREGRLSGLLVMMAARGRLVSPVNAHTPYFDLATVDEDTRGVLLTALVSARAREIVLDGIPESSPTVDWLRNAPHRRHRVERDRQRSPIVDTTLTREQFVALTKPRWGSPIERMRRKMIRENAADFHLLQTPDDLPAIVNAGLVVEASGWKGRAGTAITSRPETDRFYREVINAFSKRGQLGLSWLMFGEEMVAFDLSLLANNRLYLLKPAFDERHRKLTPGLVLRLSIVERCIELGLSAHELLGDDVGWKQKFATSSRNHVEVRLFRAGPGSAAWAYRRYLRPPLRATVLQSRQQVAKRRSAIRTRST